MSSGRFSIFRRLSWQLPLAIAGLLLVVVLLFSWAAYREVRHAVTAAAGDRLDHAAAQMALLMEQSVQTRLAETRRLAADPAVRGAIGPGGDAAGARAAFRRFADSVTAAQALELWSADGARVLEAHSRRADTLPSVEPTFPAWAGDTTAVSGFRALGDTLWFEVAVPVFSPDSGARGYLVQRRWLTSNPQASRLLGDLIGSDSAAILLGVPGGKWTDFTHVVSGPSLAAGTGAREYERAGRRLGAGRPIAGTSWVLWVELPAAPVLERVRAFLRRVAPVGLVIVLVGAAAGWVLSRRVTTPLDRIRTAAVALAGDNLPRRVTPGGPMELRDLAEAFNAMAHRIGAAHQELEGQVAERTDALRRYATDLEAANRELEAFSYSVSHDLRAPLRAIHGFSQAVMDDAGDRLDAQGLDHLRRVRAAADRMAVLIDDLLELSRVARTEMRAEPVDLSQLAHKVAAELRQGQGSRDIEVRIADGLTATGDHRLLRLALQNLLDNAWKFTSKRPRATVEVGAANGAERVFFVRDNGAGFDMTYADKLFGVFQRLHTPAEFPGTGVGLAIVQRVVHRHGGRVWAEGAPDRGATIYFTLPGSELRRMEA
jgi:signal transduction histidine kinase